MGSVGSALTITKPTVGGNYKATDEMKDLAMGMAERMQREFPELLGKTFEIKFSKYMDAAGYGFRDYIELNGAFFKKRLKKYDYNARFKQQEIDYFQGVVAHELLHSMQSRLATQLGQLGDKYTVLMNDIWGSATKKFIANNPEFTEKDLDKTVASLYGGGGHSRTGSQTDEKMAVAVEMSYREPDHVIAPLGNYIRDEFK